MVQQILLNFDATGFEGFESINDYFAYCTRTLKNEAGGVIQQKYQAAELGYSPAQWSQKVNQSNNTQVSMEDLDRYMDEFNDLRPLNNLVYKHYIAKNKNVDELLKLREQLDKQIAAARK